MASPPVALEPFILLGWCSEVQKGNIPMPLIVRHLGYLSYLLRHSERERDVIDTTKDSNTRGMVVVFQANNHSDPQVFCYSEVAGQGVHSEAYKGLSVNDLSPVLSQPSIHYSIPLWP